MLFDIYLQGLDGRMVEWLNEVEVDEMRKTMSDHTKSDEYYAWLKAMNEQTIGHMSNASIIQFRRIMAFKF